MDLEQIQFAIRPRTIFECLDVAFLFCGRHWAGLLLMSAIGVLPIAALDAWLFSQATEESLPIRTYFVTSLEIPWATSLLTLYMGQVTFSQKFSLRRALRDLLGAMIPLFLFQLLIRGACLGIFVLSPLVFLSMYYMNEILLLERPRLGKVWPRMNAMNAQSIGRLLSLRMMDTLVLCGGMPMLASLLRAISALWEERFQWGPDRFAEYLFAPDWQLTVAFWVLIVFLTVFRFVSYLDGRIRREGWDVELKLKAQAALLSQREVA